jgi:hypothetical protein
MDSSGVQWCHFTALNSMSPCDKVMPSVADPHHFDADTDPDPACHFDADPDPTSHFDPDPDPNFQKGSKP